MKVYVRFCVAVLTAAVLGFIPLEANASPILYDINFTQTLGSSKPSGSFDYDPTTQTFSNFLVAYGGATLDVTAAANAPIIDADCGGLTTGFAIMDGTTGCHTQQVWYFSGGDRTDLFFFASQDNLVANTGALHSYERINDYSLTHSNYSTDGGTFSISPASTSVPEPLTLSLFGAAVAGAAAATRRRRKASKTA